MTEFLQFGVGGITQGVVLALLAISWVLVYRVSGLLFLVAGEFVMIGSLATISFQQRGLPLALAAVAAVLLAVLVAVLLDFLVIRRVRRETHLSSVALLLGLAIGIEEVARHTFGATPQRLAPFLPNHPLTLFGASVLPQQVLLVAVAIVLLGGLWFVLEKTLFGKAMLACAQDSTGAVLVGISPSRVRTMAFGLAAGLGATGGVFLSPIATVSFSSGLGYTISGFIAAALGMWSLPGAVVAGVLVGLVEMFGAGYVSSVYQDVFPLVLLLGALILATLPGMPATLRRRLGSGTG